MRNDTLTCDRISKNVNHCHPAKEWNVKRGGGELMSEKERIALTHKRRRLSSSDLIALKYIEPKLFRLIYERDHPCFDYLHLSSSKKYSRREWALAVEQRCKTHPRELRFQDRIDGWNALHFALIRKAPINVISAILGADASYEAKAHETLTSVRTRRGSTALHIASFYGSSVDIVALLVQADSKTLRARNRCGDLPLQCAIKGDNETSLNTINVVSLLLEHYPEAIFTKGHRRGEPTFPCWELLCRWIQRLVRHANTSKKFIFETEQLIITIHKYLEKITICEGCEICKIVNLRNEIIEAKRRCTI